MGTWKGRVGQSVSCASALACLWDGVRDPRLMLAGIQECSNTKEINIHKS